jgi:hypothetical protein
LNYFFFPFFLPDFFTAALAIRMAESSLEPTLPILRLDPRYRQTHATALIQHPSSWFGDRKKVDSLCLARSDRQVGRSLAVLAGENREVQAWQSSLLADHLMAAEKAIDQVLRNIGSIFLEAPGNGRFDGKVIIGSVPVFTEHSSGINGPVLVNIAFCQSPVLRNSKI